MCELNTDREPHSLTTFFFLSFFSYSPVAPRAHLLSWNLVTIGIDFASKNLYLDDRVVRLQLWDTAGQERFRSLIPAYIRDSSVAIIVYDITNRASFLNTEQWVEDVRNERGSDVVIMMVGNKSDMAKDRQVSFEEGQERARHYGVMFIETSAKAGFNVKEMFRQLAMALPGLGGNNSTTDGEDTKSKTVKLELTDEKEQAQQGGCSC